MDKKNFWIAVGGGFVAGIGTALLVCSFCCAPRPHMMHNPMPKNIEMMQHHRPFMHGGFHHKNHHQFGEKMKAHFAKKLGLTDEQKQQLDKFRDEDMAKMKPLFEQMDSLRKQMDEMREINRAHFESVLTDEQKEILKTMKMKKGHHHKHHFAPKDMDKSVADEPKVDNDAPAEVTPAVDEEK